VPKVPEHIQNVLDVFSAPVDFQKCCGAEKKDEITAFEILAHLSRNEDNQYTARLMYSDHLLEVFSEQHGQAYGLDKVEVVGFSPFENFEKVAFKVRETANGHGSDSTADNNKGASG
jgi:hypothetical protein